MKGKRNFRSLIFIVLVSLALYFLLSKATGSKASFSFLYDDKFRQDKPLEQVVTSSMAGSKGKYGIVIKDLSSNNAYFSNDKDIFLAGSLYKLWIMATAFKQIESGELKVNEELSANIADLNAEFGISPDLAELTEGGIDLTVNEALNQMITISHNYAAMLLTKKVRLSNVEAFLKNNGFTQSNVGTDGGDPKTSPSDIALFLEKLYRGELANNENTEKMINLLKAQKLNDKLPKYLPKGTVIAHKTGEIEYFSHDGGIVYGPKNNYIIVVFSETEFPSGAEERIANLSKDVYGYYERKKGGDSR